MSNFLRPLVITLWLVVFLVGSIWGGQNSSAVAIVGAHLVRLDGSGVLRDSVVLIENERISAIGAASDVTIPTGARKIRLDNAWLAPGLMNMHVHWGLILPGKEAARLANETNAALALRMAKNARDSLLSGTTTVRMPGDRRHADLALMRAIERGDAVGPRLVSAGESVPITHGHGAKGRTGFDGPYELMKGVRKQIQAGATWIKIAISGGIATDGGGIAQELAAAFQPRKLPGAESAIDVVRRSGVRAGVLSNFAYMLPLVLAEVGLGNLLNPIIVSASVGYEKPDPRIFMAAAAAIQADPCDCVLIGDDLTNDVEGAKASGMPVVWLQRDGKVQQFNGSGIAIARSLDEAVHMAVGEQWRTLSDCV